MRDRTDWTRRSFLRAAGAGVLGAAAAPSGAIFGDSKAELIIDCHAHIYSEDENKYPPIEKPYRPPAGTGTVDHLRREALTRRGEGRSGVRFVTAIHTSTFYRWDNRFTADASRDNKDFLAGVCTLDPDDPSSSKTLEDYVKAYNVRGMRSIPAKSGKLDDPGVDALWETAERLGIVINVLTNADKQGEIEALVKRHQKLRIVIDHCLNIKAGPTLEPTLAAMRALAAYPAVHAKLSFIPTGSAEEYPCRDMHEPCRAVIEAFGPERCVWGSCFPCELWCPKVSYAQHLNIFEHVLGLDDKARRAILGETPQRLWFPHPAPRKQGVPDISDEWRIRIEGYGGTPVDRTWFRAALAADGTMHVGRSRRQNYRKTFQGKVTDDEIKRFYRATAKIINGYLGSKSQGKSDDGWNWTVEISSKTSMAEAKYRAHWSLEAADPGFEELGKIIKGHLKEGERFPE
jgi:predicted TIM-barrel fold metal-dependent hydrolase